MVNYVLKFALLTMAIIFSAVGVAQEAEVIASVDKNPIIQSEPFTLTVTINDDVSESVWDAEQQLKDFRILNVRSSRRTSVINGVTTRTTSFIVNLQAPATPGIVRIPPIQIGAAKSNAIELTILDAATSVDELEQRPAFIRTSLESKRVYVQQQFKLVSRLYLSANLHSGNLIAPNLAEAEVVQFGKDEESYEIINGKRYQVFQRTYLITPQRSGDLTLEGPVFEGQITRDTNRSVFSAIATTQPVSAVAVPTSITVLPRPADWQGHWLPSELVSVSVERANPEQPVEVGQPITLTYRVTAIGVNTEQLPALSFENIENASVYPESPEFASTTRNGRVIAQRAQTVAVIPRQAGAFEIPAVQVEWFNTRLGQAQIAASEPITLEISPSSQPATPNPAKAEPAATEPAQASSTEQPEPAASAAEPALYYYLAIIFAVLWLLTLIIWAWWWLRRPSATKTVVGHTEQDASSASWRHVQKVALTNDATATDLALRQWARETYQLPMQDLFELARYFSHQPLTSQIEHLQRCRFSSSGASWLEGKALIRALKAAQKHRKVDRQKTPQLSPLYPN
ncbi:Oxygen tolerance [Pseudidiomarina maritima]|uniref:Oxygen tolerance n=1 Tax=Pseudidiomarina maritima TaxID=519453 RepID=A0A1I6GMJ6_9GAMM|nr:BatD family protein [Pseudidiomarina maritima]SFR43388.1 Oxygen tolerance [Pseudidiomarina maritima]